MYLYIDIETIPGGERPRVEDLKCPGTYKKPDSIKAWYDDPARREEVEEVFRKTALDPWSGQIVCIAWKLVDEDYDDIVINTLDYNNELELLKEFEFELRGYPKKQFDKMSVVHFIGHNIKSFDIPFLYLRAAKYDLKWLQQVIPNGFQRDRIYDTMEMCAVTARMTPDKYVGLDKACRFFGLDGKGDIDGSMVYDLYKEGRYQEISDYCKADVERVIELHKRLR
jgi:3'-5' exonuclease